MVLSSARSKLVAIQRQRDAADKELMAFRQDGKLTKALADWDNVVWLDELYDLTDRIPDVNALRITQISTEPLTRTAKDRYIARITLKGNCYDEAGRKALNDLIDGFKKDGYYSPEAPKIEFTQFPLTVKVERRPPADYTRKLPPPPTAARKTTAPTAPTIHLRRRPMNPRERFLAITVLSVVILAVAGFLFKWLFLDSLGRINADINTAKADIAKKEDEKQKEMDDEKALLRRRPAGGAVEGDESARGQSPGRGGERRPQRGRSEETP